MFPGASAVTTGLAPVDFSVSETDIATEIGFIECTTTTAIPPAPTFTLENDDAPFELTRIGESNIATLTRTTELDYDTGPTSYRLLVTCSDSIGSVSDNVTVTILPENDNLPEYSTEPDVITIRETAPAGTVVASQGSDGLANIIVSDGDRGEDGELTFMFSAVTDDALEMTHFQMDETDGTISLTRPLDVDMEFIVSESLEVLICDGNRPQNLCKIVNVAIVITSINEFDPQFSQPSYLTNEHTYSEGDYSEVVIATVACTDMDQGEGALDHIQLLDSGLPLELVALSAGVANIVLNGSVDYEVIRMSEVELQLICFDKSQPPKTDSASLTLNIQDLDDNLPQFNTSSYTALVPETRAPGSVLLTLECRDDDYGAGALTGVQLSEPSRLVAETFRVDPASGELTLTKPLDYDSGLRLSYEFDVVCSDSAGNVAIASVNITVLSVNDEPVAFNRSEYNFTVDRLKLPGVVVGQVMASDRDIDPLQHITFSIEHNRHFEIDGDGQIVLSSVILFIEGNYFTLTVTASDGVNNETTALVNVRVSGHMSVLDIAIIAGSLTLAGTIILLVCCIARCIARKRGYVSTPPIYTLLTPCRAAGDGDADTDTEGMEEETAT